MPFGIVEATADYTPIFWLLDRFMKDPDVKAQEARARLPGLVAELERVLAADPKLKVAR